MNRYERPSTALLAAAADARYLNQTRYGSTSTSGSTATPASTATPGSTATSGSAATSTPTTSSGYNSTSGANNSPKSAVPMVSVKKHFKLLFCLISKIFIRSSQKYGNRQSFDATILGKPCEKTLWYL